MGARLMQLFEMDFSYAALVLLCFTSLFGTFCLWIKLKQERTQTEAHSQEKRKLNEQNRTEDKRLRAENEQNERLSKQRPRKVKKRQHTQWNLMEKQRKEEIRKMEEQRRKEKQQRKEENRKIEEERRRAKQQREEEKRLRQEQRKLEEKRRLEEKLQQEEEIRKKECRKNELLTLEKRTSREKDSVDGRRWRVEAERTQTKYRVFEEVYTENEHQKVKVIEEHVQQTKWRVQNEFGQNQRSLTYEEPRPGDRCRSLPFQDKPEEPSGEPTEPALDNTEQIDTLLKIGGGVLLGVALRSPTVRALGTMGVLTYEAYKAYKAYEEQEQRKRDARRFYTDSGHQFN